VDSIVHLEVRGYLSGVDVEELTREKRKEGLEA
jgi:hypothetical protein